MAIKYTDDVARLEGKCTLHEAEALCEWLRKTSKAKLDLSGCEHLHTAVLQVILVAKTEIIAAPQDAWLSATLASQS